MTTRLPRTLAAVLAAALTVAGLVTIGVPGEAAPAVHVATAAVSAAGEKELPLGGTTIFPTYQLVAYYGTAGTPALGVLGEGTIPQMTQRLRQAARPFRASGKPVQIVYELIVSVADAHPGPDGNYSHFIAREKVERFVNAARRNKALLVLDLQPGRQSFLPRRGGSGGHCGSPSWGWRSIPSGGWGRARFPRRPWATSEP